MMNGWTDSEGGVAKGLHMQTPINRHMTINARSRVTSHMSVCRRTDKCVVVEVSGVCVCMCAALLLKTSILL